MQWIGERFVDTGTGWIDAATGRPVQLRLLRADPAAALAADDDCARLARIRHPLLHALLDYGCASRDVRFEAYERPGRATSGAPAAGSVDWLDELLGRHGVSLDAGRAPLLVRHVVAHPARSIGITLQPRHALSLVEEALDRMAPPGPALIHVRGPDGMGLRTFRDLLARAARIRGFVPLGPGALAVLPQLLAEVKDRHVCVLDDEGRASMLSQVVAELARSSTRRHVIVRLHRASAPGRRDLALEPLSPDVLMRMVWSDRGDPPDASALQRAAAAAEGRPGVFIAALRGTYPAPRPTAMFVHETAPRYGPPARTEAPPDPPVIAGRILGSAVQAESRAAALAARGRHAAAARVLLRGLRVLEGRERRAEAAGCALSLGILALDRGRVDPAIEYLTRGVELGSARASAATVAYGVALTDADRLPEAEAVLRGALVGSPDADGTVAAAAALARCLLWQDRYEEAIAVAEAHRGRDAGAAARARLLATLARCEVRAGRGALPTAREAQAMAAGAHDPRVTASADLALAEALRAAGDRTGAEVVLGRVVRIARAAHLPLFRIRAWLVSAGDAQLAPSARQRFERIPLPPLLARRMSAAHSGASPARAAVEPVAELESLLDVAQRASDDRTALGEICRAVAGRLGAAAVAVVDAQERTLALEGRGWRPATPAVRHVIACGTRMMPDTCREPQEAAEPVRYGGQVIGALACRWTAGSTIDREGATVVLRAAALSVSASLQAILDTALPSPPSHWGDLLGESPAAAALREAAQRAARAPFPVLIEGESGSGKELVARAVHRLGPRRERKFCALNCAALSDDLVEAELFGHTRGAFTGAAGERAGLFEEADGGTLFLDEVGELSPRAQAKLLRVLQEGEVRRIGENLPRRVDVRVIAATNRRLEDEAAAGRFRADLRFRLDVVRITVPPLRERATDIPVLAAHFWREASARVGSQATLSPDALAALARYDWPGNVRELQNVIAWIAVHSPRRGRVGPSVLPAHVAGATPTTAGTFEAAREEFERRFIRAALAGANGRRSKAADALGITRQGLAKMMRRLRIDAP